MRKSNLLIIAAVAVLVVSLGMYNVALKGAYLKGTYKDPFQDYKAIDIRDFQAIDINSANKLGVKIKPGKFGVWVHERSTGFVQVKRIGNRLQLDADFPDREGYNERVIITCPSLTEITTNSIFRLKGKQEVLKKDYNNNPVTVEGFTLDSLQLTQDNASGIRLAKNKIRTLRSTTGISPGAGSHLEIEADNTIGQAHLKVQHKGSLSLQSARINSLAYDFGDSTKVTVTGAAMGLLKK
jgi:hypothetical protein